MNKENTGISSYTRSHKRAWHVPQKGAIRVRTSKSFYHLRLELLPPPLSLSLKPGETLWNRPQTHVENGWRTIRDVFTPTDLFSKLHEIYPEQGLVLFPRFPLSHNTRRNWRQVERNKEREGPPSLSPVLALDEGSLFLGTRRPASTLQSLVISGLEMYFNSLEDTVASISYGCPFIPRGSQRERGAKEGRVGIRRSV